MNNLDTDSAESLNGINTYIFTNVAICHYSAISVFKREMRKLTDHKILFPSIQHFLI